MEINMLVKDAIFHLILNTKVIQSDFKARSIFSEEGAEIYK